MTATTERLQQPAEVKDDLREALKIVAELNPPVDLRVFVFQIAAQMVTARRVVEHGAGAINLGALGTIQGR